jgi:SAM-dependent methyltransferase
MGSINLSRDEVEFHPLSFFDENGRVFRWNGDLYRVVSPAREAFYRRAFEQGLIERLVARRLLVETEIADLTLDGSMVLRHRSLPLISYPFEWCPEMLRDAALTTLALERELEREGLMLQDAHPLNVLFDGSAPLWVDLGSFVPLSGNGVWAAHDEFCSFFLNPLRLIAAGQGRLARWLLHDDLCGVHPSEVEPFLPVSVGSVVATSVRSTSRRVARAAWRQAPPAFRRPLQPIRERVRRRRNEHDLNAGRSEVLLDHLEQQVRELELPVTFGAWSNYYDSFPEFVPSSEWTAKETSVNDVLRRVGPGSVLDIGSNRGWHSLLAAKRGNSVAAIDTDEGSIRDLYARARSESLPIQALLADFRRLSMGYGPGESVLAPANERLRSDLVLALAITHHLVFSARFDFRQIVTALAAFTRKALLVEFVPADDEYVREWHPETRPWYTLDHFLATLRGEFALVEVLPSHPEPRVLVFCSRE